MLRFPIDKVATVPIPALLPRTAADQFDNIVLGGGRGVRSFSVGSRRGRRRLDALVDGVQVMPHLIRFDFTGAWACLIVICLALIVFGRFILKIMLTTSASFLKVHGIMARPG